MESRAPLDAFLDRFLPEVAADAREALCFLTQRLPTATRLVYDSYNALAVTFGPSERSSEAVLSIAVYPRYVSLFFLQDAPRLPDPAGLLEGSGTSMRHIKLAPVSRLRQPGVANLIDVAMERAKVPLPAAGNGPTIIKPASARQRSRRP